MAITTLGSAFVEGRTTSFWWTNSGISLGYTIPAKTGGNDRLMTLAIAGRDFDEGTSNAPEAIPVFGGQVFTKGPEVGLDDADNRIHFYYLDEAGIAAGETDGSGWSFNLETGITDIIDLEPVGIFQCFERPEGTAISFETLFTLKTSGPGSPGTIPSVSMTGTPSAAATVVSYFAAYYSSGDDPALSGDLVAGDLLATDRNSNINNGLTGAAEENVSGLRTHNYDSTTQEFFDRASLMLAMVEAAGGGTIDELLNGSVVNNHSSNGTFEFVGSTLNELLQGSVITTHTSSGTFESTIGVIESNVFTDHLVNGTFEFIAAGTPLDELLQGLVTTSHTVAGTFQFVASTLIDELLQGNVSTQHLSSGTFEFEAPLINELITGLVVSRHRVNGTFTFNGELVTDLNNFEGLLVSPLISCLKEPLL